MKLKSCWYLVLDKYKYFEQKVFKSYKYKHLWPIHNLQQFLVPPELFLQFISSSNQIAQSFNKSLIPVIGIKLLLKLNINVLTQIIASSLFTNTIIVPSASKELLEELWKNRWRNLWKELEKINPINWWMK